MKSRGVIYSATTNIAYLEAALISAIALRQHEPEIPITLICDQPVLKLLQLDEYQISSRLLETNGHAFSSRDIKTRLNAFSPYQETLFLDADILPIGTISGLWDYVSKGDMAMVVDRLPTVSLCDHVSQEEKSYTLGQVPGNTVQFNSGVMLWRDTQAVQSLFSQWHQEWGLFGKQDQLALVRAIHKTQLSITKLPKTYNISPIDAADLMQENNTVHLLHCWGGMVVSGKFRELAHEYYPHVVETVVKLLGTLVL